MIVETLSLDFVILFLKSTRGELAQLARAPALHAGGQGFDSLILHDNRRFIFKKAYRAKNNICEIS